MTIERMKDINAFVHVAEAKSFTTAAEQIGLSRSAVGKSVSRLEDRLGVLGPLKGVKAHVDAGICNLVKQQRIAIHAEGTHL